jgi:DNA-binding NarL/FixJ family response regulator
MISIHSMPQYAARAKREGAAGYCNKEKAGAELVHAVATILAGGSYFLQPAF